MYKKKKIITLVIILVLITLGGLFIYNFINDSNNQSINKYSKEDIENPKFVRIKYLVMEKNDENYSLKEAFPDHFDEYLSFESEYMLLTEGKKYYTINIKKQANERVLKNITDYAFAINNNSAEMVDDCIFDKEDLEIKIPKKYFEKEYDNVEFKKSPVQIEILSRLTKEEIQNLSLNVKMKNIVSKNNTIERNGNKTSFSITALKGKKEEDIMVFLNETLVLLSKNFYTYNSKKGTINFNISPILVDKIEVVYKNKILNNVKAVRNYASYSSEMSVHELSENPATKPKKGTKGKIILGINTHGSNTILLEPVRGSSAINTIDDIKIGDFKNAVTSTDDTIEITSKKTDVNDNGKIDSNEFPYKFSNFFIGTNCVHIPISGNTGHLGGVDEVYKQFDWKIVDVDDEDDGYVYFTVIFMLDPTKYYYSGTSTEGVAQTLVTITKFRYKDDSAKIVVTKKLKDGTTVTNANGDNQFTIGLYSDNKCSKQIGNSKATNSKGKVSFTTEDYGIEPSKTYYISEELTDDQKNNWTPENSCLKVTTKSSEDSLTNGFYVTSTSYTNIKKKYCAKVRKVDVEDNTCTLKGIKFNLKNSSGNVTINQDTKASGIAEFKDLNYDTYYYAETSSNGTKAESSCGGSFNYYNDDKSYKTATIVEMKGYDSSTGTYKECTVGSANISIKEDHKTYYCMKVKKIDKKTGQALSGAVFTIDGTTTTATTNSSGIATFMLGATTTTSYKVKETTAPVGYELPSGTNAEKTITATAMPNTTIESTSKTISNCNASVTEFETYSDSKLLLNWYKVAEDGTTKLKGAKFKVKSAGNNDIKVSSKVSQTDDSNVTKSCYVYSTSGSITELESDDNGEVCISGVPKGTYTIEETKPAEYHTFGSSKTKSLTTNIKFQTMSDSNKFINSPTYFVFTKSTDDTSIDSEILSRLKKIDFQIFKANSSGNKDGNALTFVLKNDVYHYYPGSHVSGSTTTTLHINDSKQISVAHLPEGNYLVIENNTCISSDCDECSGYYNSLGTVNFTISNCSSSSATSCGSNGRNATASMVNKKTEITFTKEDFYKYYNNSDKVEFESENEIKEFDAITFKLKDNSGNYVQLQKISDGNYRYTKGSGNNQVTELHTKNGALTITYLCKNSQYKIEEVAVPENSVFILPSPHPEVTYKIGETATEVNQALTKIMSNTPTKVEIWKIDASTGEFTEPYENNPSVKFNLYRCNDESCSNRTKINVEKALATFNDGSVDVDAYRYSKQNVSNSNTTDTLTTHGGKIIIRYLPAGKYVIVETDAPDGYYLPLGTDAETLFEVSQATISSDAIQIENDSVQIIFSKDDINKYYNENDPATNSINTKLLDTAKFNLQMRKNDGTWETLSLKLIGRNETDGYNEYRYLPIVTTNLGTSNPGDKINDQTMLNTYKGKLKITHLYNNTMYRIVEIETTEPANFILPQPNPYVTYDIGNTKPSDESITQILENVPTRVRFIKKDKETNEVINNTAVRFELYKCSDDACSKNSRERIYVTPGEWISNNVLDSHSYNDTLNNHQNELEFAYKYSKLNAVTDVEITTYNGEIIIRYLPAGKYALVETHAPDGYYLPMNGSEDTIFEVLKTTVEQDINVIENEYVEITFNKEDIYDYYTKEEIDRLDSEEKRLDQAKFQIKDDKGNILKLRFIEKNNERGNVYRFLSAEEESYPISNNGYLIPKYKDKTGNMVENDIDEIYTEKGKLTITHLKNSTKYIIEEIEAPDGFILPEEHPQVVYNIHETKPVKSDDESITQTIDNVPTRVRFEKRDSKYNYLIPDETTTFEVYRYEKGTECHPNTDKSNCELVHFNERAVINGDKEDPTDIEGISSVEVYKMIRPSDVKKGKNGVTELHPYKGILVLRYLSDDFDYVLLETVAPRNYKLPIGENAETHFEVSGTTIDVTEVDVPNKPTSILIKKYSSDGNLLTGAKFKIYEGTTCDANLSPMNQPKRELKLKTVRDGVYENRPVQDTSVITTCTDTENSKCSDIPVNELTKLTYTDYLGSWAEYGNVSGNDNEKDKYTELQEGEALIQYLEYGHCYIIEEVKAPKGYSLPEDDARFTMLTIKENDSYEHTTEKTLVNTPTPFTFYKFDEYNQLLDGAEFKLQKLDNNKKYQDITVSEEEKDGKLYYKVDKDTENKTIKTKNGSATVYYLEEGQYRIIETKPAEGKELTKNPNIATFFVDNNGSVFGNSIIVNKGKTEKIKLVSKARAELIITPSSGQTVIKYGLIITILLATITGLIILKKKTK